MQKKQTYPSLHSFIQKTRVLLKKQQQAEKELFQELTQHKSYSEIQQQGAGLSNMLVLGCRDGLYDKIILSLKKSYHSDKNPVKLPDHCKLQVGDDVVIYHGHNNIAEGVVYKRTSEKIKIAINQDSEENQDFQGFKVNIVMKWNQVTYKRYHSVLDRLQQPREQSYLTQLMFNSTARGYKPKNPQKYQNKKMNDKQNQAIANGLVQLCHLIHGPPGTGKTTTVCQLIVEAVNRGQKVLACAPSNIAVDNIVEGISHRVNCVRIGNPTRMIPDVLYKCLDFLVDKQQGNWKSQQKKLNAAQKKIKRANSKAQRKQIYGEIKQLRKQIRNLQQQVITEIVLDADVICCTNAGAADRVFKRYLNKRVFDLVVIDQCGQGLEVSCWIPLLRGKRAVLAGDHKQLPPTVKFQQDSLLGYTLFSRAMDQLVYITSTMLQVQYRMNKVIMGWSNGMFYGNKLKAHQSVQNHQLIQIYDGVDKDEESIMFLDTAGCQIGEEGGNMQSKMNIGEADLITFILKKILGYGVKTKDIAILTPYSKQVTLLKNNIHEKLGISQNQIPEVSTVDGIQGRQKQCILISLVRSNPEKQVGFLKDWRRMNVAVTRARRMLIVVGDSDTVGVDEKINSLIEWISNNGGIQSAEQLRDEEQIRFGLGKISTPLQKTNNQKKQVKQNKTQQKRQKNQKNKNKAKKKNQQKFINNNGEPTKGKVAPKLHTEDQNQKKRQQYRTVLQNLQQIIVLRDISAYQRMIIHQVAQSYGYEHYTSQNKDRITIKPKNIRQFQSQQIQQQEQQKEQIKPKNKKKNKKNKNKQKLPPQSLHDLVQNNSDSDSQPQQQIQVPEIQNQQKQESVTNKTKKSKKNKKKKKEQQKPQQEEDWQKIMDQFEKDLVKKDQCYKCLKKITSVTAAQCRFCHRYFCRHDLLAEQHGCEEAASYQARKGNLDRFIEKGSQRIQQKLKEQQQQRQKKHKDDKDHKKK